MRETLRIDRKVTLDARYLLARVVPFLLRRIGVLDALRINDAKGRFLVAPRLNMGHVTT